MSAATVAALSRGSLSPRWPCSIVTPYLRAAHSMASGRAVARSPTPSASSCSAKLADDLSAAAKTAKTAALLKVDMS